VHAEESEEEADERDAEEAELLAEVRQDEVGVARREVVELLAAGGAKP
jgi:hypothetical protein